MIYCVGNFTWEFRCYGNKKRQDVQPSVTVHLIFKYLSLKNVLKNLDFV